MLTCIRRSELVNLKWVDVRWEEKEIIIRNPKSGKEYEVVPLINAAAEVLKHQRQQMHLCTASCLAADRVFFDSYGRPIAKGRPVLITGAKLSEKKLESQKAFASYMDCDITLGVSMQPMVPQCHCFRN